MKEERNPLFDVSVVSGRAAAEFVVAVAVLTELSVAERGDKVEAPQAIKEVRVHGHSSKRVVKQRPLAGLRVFLRPSSPLSEPVEHHEKGSRQQDVNISSHGAPGHQRRQPQNSQYDSNRPEHVVPSGLLDFGFYHGHRLRQGLALGYGV